MLDKFFNVIKSPSVQYMIFNKDSIIYYYADGSSAIGTEKANNTTTYNLSSITKTFTALAVLQLASLGKFNIDDSVIKYIPELPYNDDVTIRSLLNHSSGIVDPVPHSWTHSADSHSFFNADKFFSEIINKAGQLSRKPGEKFWYSNLGYMILGKLIERVSFHSYEEYVNKNILQKLHSHELTFLNDNTDKHASGYEENFSLTNIVSGHLFNRKRSVNESHWKPYNTFYVDDPGYGGLIGTASGLAAYMQEFLMRDSSIITQDIKSLLLSENILTNGKPSGMCMSWFKGKLKDYTYYTHAGLGGGYYSEVRIYPESGLGSVILLNRNGTKDERILDITDIDFLRSYKPLSEPDIYAELHAM